MYRMLVMYPSSADPVLVDDLVERTAAVFKQRAGFRSVSTNVDALMGPSARAGEVRRLLEVDFATLDDALAALHHDSFQEVKSITESLGTKLFLYELSEL